MKVQIETKSVSELIDLVGECRIQILELEQNKNSLYWQEYKTRKKLNQFEVDFEKSGLPEFQNSINEARINLYWIQYSIDNTERQLEFWNRKMEEYDNRINQIIKG